MSTATADPRAGAIPDRLVPRVEVARLFDVSEQTINAWVLAKRLPAPIKIGRRSYWQPDVLARVLSQGTEG
jgi:predicted DNA-binding transcriptional regulator AlpA